MQKISITDIEHDELGEESIRRMLSDVVGTSDIALNHYRLAPGDGFPGGLHAHMDQEEVFVVLEGQATFEAMDGEVTVEAGEVVRFAPGEFQSGKNTADENLVVLALGAPRETANVRIPAVCPECNHPNLRLDFRESGMSFVCPSCKSEQTPSDCPDCGHDDLRLTRRDGRTVTVCQNCGSVYESPPLQE